MHHEKVYSSTSLKEGDTVVYLGVMVRITHIDQDQDTPVWCDTSVTISTMEGGKELGTIRADALYSSYIKHLAKVERASLLWTRKAHPMQVCLLVTFEGSCWERDALDIILEDWDCDKGQYHSEGYGMNLLRSLHDFLEVRELSQAKDQILYVLTEGSESSKVVGFESLNFGSTRRLFLSEVCDFECAD